MINNFRKEDKKSKIKELNMLEKDWKMVQKVFLMDSLKA
jgi:hypothetical protein